MSRRTVDENGRSGNWLSARGTKTLACSVKAAVANPKFNAFIFYKIKLMSSTKTNSAHPRYRR